MNVKLTKIAVGIVLIASLAACSSTTEKEKQIEAIASHRATVLSNNLPVEHGPLTIMQAKAKGKVVEIMMLYNDDANSNVPPQVLVTNAIKSYCLDKEVKANLEHGIAYNIKLRSARGQLLVEQAVTLATCQAQAEAK